VRRIAVDSLGTTASLPRPLYHESGALLFAPGERVSEDEVALLRKTGIKKVYDLGGDGDPGAVPGEDTSTGPVPVEPSHVPDEVRRFRRERRAVAALRALERAAARLRPERVIGDPRGELREGGVERAIERSRAGESPEGPPWRERLDALRPDGPRSPREKQDAVEVRRATIARLAAIFAAIRSGGAAARDEVDAVARDVFVAAARDVDLAIALVTEGLRERPADEHGALALHCHHVATLALACAIELGYGLEQLFELSYASLLHDVGMLRLPGALLTKPGEFDPEERRELERHPLHAMEILRRFEEVPVALAAVVADEHERPDGSGYPRGAEPGEFARIVAVADTLEALAGARLHHPARPAGEALRELVALAAKKKLDARAVRALMKALSLFPVGTWVRLSDGALARVVRGGGADAARPVVAVVSLEPPAAVAWIDLAERVDIRIAEPVPAPPGAEALLGF
jgi:HD-GYP domain-containing protein (c-di-GMP phosphodiesterase class II)